MAEENMIIIDDDLIIIDDDDDLIAEQDVVIIDDLMDIDNIHESDESDIEIEPLEDSGCDSDNSCNSVADLLQKKQKNLNLQEIVTLNEETKICCISYYYKEGGSKYCTECFFRLSEMFIEARSIRKHITAACENITNIRCKECERNLNQILPCNMCPICTN